jgi:hypothetical protein
LSVQRPPAPGVAASTRDGYDNQTCCFPTSHFRDVWSARKGTHVHSSRAGQSLRTALPSLPHRRAAYTDHVGVSFHISYLLTGIHIPNSGVHRLATSQCPTPVTRKGNRMDCCRMEPRLREGRADILKMVKHSKRHDHEPTPMLRDGLRPPPIREAVQPCRVHGGLQLLGR